MKDRETPLKIEGIYPGFWLRLGSFFLDGLILSPAILLNMYLNSQGKFFSFYALIPFQLFYLVYYVCFVKIYGGTPAKLILGLKIIKTTDEAIEWRTSLIRYSPYLILGSIFVAEHSYCLLKADDIVYKSLTWGHQTKYLLSFSPLHHSVFWVEQIWFGADIIVLIVNKRRRALHDLLAGTVVVKTKYINEISRVVNETEETITGPTDEATLQTDI
jgi:uncharacterized RDD family membrane protein YckC